MCILVNKSKIKYSIATLGSHCSLQILKGAKDEGFNTLLICEKRRLGLYKRFNFIDDMIVVDKFNEISNEVCQQHLRKTNSIIIPHGTMVAYMSREEIEKISTPFFGNKWIIRWEADRKLKQKLMDAAQLTTPNYIVSKENIKSLCIIKLHGAAGGRG